MRTRVLLLTAACSLIACDASAAPPEVVIADVVADYMPGALELAITPTPQHARLTDELVRVGSLRVVEATDAGTAPRTVYEQLADRIGDGAAAVPTRVLVGGAARNPATARVLPALDLPASIADRGAEAYHLYAGPDPEVPGGTLLVLAGATAQGDFWALQSLVQLVARRGGERFVRRAAIADWPTIARRGNKRPQPWEHRYKANFAWAHVGDDPAFARVFRTEGAWYHHVGKLDVASEPWMRAIERSAAAALARGVRDLVVKFDDTPTTMTRATGQAFSGDYYAAQAAFVRRFHAWLREVEPSARLVFLPQAYWTNAFDILEQSQGLAKGGGIPADVALCLTGQEVISRTIPAESVRRARALFGLTRRKAWIYDNLIRGGDLGPYAGRDPKLADEVDCVFAERGTALARITLQDYLWNPAAYDPARSWRLACRDLAERDPRTYRALRDYVTAWDAAQYPLVGGDAARAVLRSSTRTLAADVRRLRKRLVDEHPDGLAVQTGFVDELVSGSAGDTATIAERSAYLDRMLRHGYREAIVRKRGGDVSIDGDLSEPAWERARPLGEFVYFRDSGPRSGAPGPAPPLVPAGEQTRVRLLWDDDALLVAVRLRHREPPRISQTRRQLLAGERRPGAWRVPSIEILLDPDRDRRTYFHVILNLEGWSSESHAEGFGTTLAPGPWWKSGTRFAAVAGEHESVIEARIPFASLGGRPEPGTRWHAQFARNLNGASTWSYHYEFFGFRWPQHFGTLAFED